MNKELIKKYKKEFDHWLNGGKVITLSNNNYYLIKLLLFHHLANGQIPFYIFLLILYSFQIL